MKYLNNKLNSPYLLSYLLVFLILSKYTFNLFYNDHKIITYSISNEIINIIFSYLTLI